MMMKKQIKYDQEEILGLFDESKKQTVDSLNGFVKKLLNEYEVDDDYKVFAISLAGLTGMNLMCKEFKLTPDKSDVAIHAVWDLFRRWLNYRDDPLLIVDYIFLLNENYDESTDFNRISPETAEWLKNEARIVLKLNESGELPEPFTEERKMRIMKIANGELPKPFYVG